MRWLHEERPSQDAAWPRPELTHRNDAPHDHYGAVSRHRQPMLLIDRYIFRQFLGSTLLASAALIALAVISQSLSALGVIIDQRQSVIVFVKVIALAMPQLIVLILPVGVLIGAMAAMNRLRTDQEIVICSAAGLSRRRVMAPGFELAGAVAVISLILSLWIQPVCYRALRDTLETVRGDLAASLIRPGRFTHPAPGLTVYAKSVDDDGAIHNLFINRVTKAGRDITVTAQEGRFERRNGTPMLVMREGANQEFTREGILNYLSFDEYVLDLSPISGMTPRERYKLSDRYPHELFFPDLTDPFAAANLNRLHAEGNSRIAGSLYSIAFMAMTFAGAGGGAFNRNGYSQRIAAVAVAALVTRTLGFAVEAASATTPAVNLAQYAVPLLATAIALAVAVPGADPRSSDHRDGDGDDGVTSVRLQVYLLGRTLAGVAAALGVLTAVIMLIDLVELSRTLNGKTELSFIELLFLDALKSPAIVLILLPFVFLFGVMAAFVSLSRRGELVAMRAAGVSAWRFLSPAAAASFVIGVITVGALNPAASALNGQFEDRRAALSDQNANPSGGEIWLRQGDDREQIVIHARGHDTVAQTLRLTGVSLFVQSVGRGGSLAFSRRIEAARALLMPGYWTLTDVREAAPGAGATRSPQMQVPSSLDHRSAMEKFASPGAIAFWDLPSTIHSANLAGYSAAPYRLRLQQLLATPLMFTAMAVLAGAFSLRLMRLGDFARVSAVGVALGFGVFFLNQFCGALGSNGEIPASLAAWTPPVLALLTGITLLCYTEDG